MQTCVGNNATSHQWILVYQLKKEKHRIANHLVVYTLAGCPYIAAYYLKIGNCNMWNRLRKIMSINLLCALWNGCHYRISLVEYKVWRPRLWKMCNSTWKNKEHYSRSKYKADKWYDVSWHMQLHMSNDKQWRNTIHYVKPTAQLLFKSQFPKGEHKKPLELYLPIHDTLIGKLQGMHCQCGIWIHAVLTVMQES